MKNFLLILSCLYFVSCINESDDVLCSNNSSKLSMEDIAIQAYYDCFAQETRSISKLTVKNVIALKRNNHRSVSSNPLLYVVNFEDSLGFAIISNSPNTTPVIGISNSANFDPTEDIESDSFEYFLQNAENYVSISSTNDFGIGDEPLQPIITACSPKINVLWGQRSPYGSHFQNGIAGCSNIATAQIMSYFKYPSSMQIQDGNTTYTLNLDWDEICLHKKNITDCCEEDAISTHNTISTFIRQIGRDNLSDDSGANATSTWDYNALRSLIKNNYRRSSTLPFSSIDYKNYLNNDYLIYMSGADYNGQGHDWVMDGYKVLYTRLSVSPVLISKTYCHYNWGANGKYNGYFLEGVFCISDAYQYDGEVGNETRDYQYGVYCTAVKPN